MKRVLVLQHMQDDPAAYVGEILHDNGIEYDVVMVENETLPDPERYGAIIVFGGSQHVYEKDLHPYFVQERTFIKKVIQQELPFLGICLGGQLLADALDAEVRKHHTTEIGFFDVELTEAGKTDPLYAGLPTYQKVYHWHEDAFLLPEDAILLATHENAENQAFRFGRRAYGLQYHIELDKELLHMWLHTAESKQSIIEAIGEEAYALIVAEEPYHYPIYQKHSRIIVENFLKIGELI